MPTTTEVFARTLTNLGPLTTTFTAAPSCTALAKQPHGGYIYVHYPGAGNYSFPIHFAPVECTAQNFASCLPNGEARQHVLEHDDVWTQAYNSPGLHCPSGWTTVMSVTGASASAIAKTLSSPDDYDLTTDDLTSGRLEAFALSALAPTEAVTLCCPSGYSTYPFAWEGPFACTSRFGWASSFSISTYCSNIQSTTDPYVTMPFGVVTEGPEPAPGAATHYTHLPLTNTEQDASPSFDLAHTFPVIMLINTVQATATPTTRTGEAGTKGGKSAAGGLRPNVLTVLGITSLAAVVVAFLDM